MNPTRDDDALNWAGDEDPTLQVGDVDRAAPEPIGMVEDWTVAEPSFGAKTSADAVGSDDVEQLDDADTAAPEPETGDEPAAQSSAALVGMGILGGMYLLYTIGWFIGVSRIDRPTSDPVAQFMFSVGTWLAVAAPLAWFGATFWLTTNHPRARLAWLLAGVILLVPLPFIFGIGVGR